MTEVDPELLELWRHVQLLKAQNLLSPTSAGGELASSQQSAREIFAGATPAAATSSSSTSFAAAAFARQAEQTAEALADAVVAGLVKTSGSDPNPEEPAGVASAAKKRPNVGGGHIGLRNRPSSSPLDSPTREKIRISLSLETAAAAEPPPQHAEGAVTQQPSTPENQQQLRSKCAGSGACSKQALGQAHLPLGAVPDISAVVVGGSSSLSTLGPGSGTSSGTGGPARRKRLTDGSSAAAVAKQKLQQIGASKQTVVTFLGPRPTPGAPPAVSVTTGPRRRAEGSTAGGGLGADSIDQGRQEDQDEQQQPPAPPPTTANPPSAATPARALNTVANFQPQIPRFDSRMFDSGRESTSSTVSMTTTSRESRLRSLRESTLQRARLSTKLGGSKGTTLFSGGLTHQPQLPGGRERLSSHVMSRGRGNGGAFSVMSGGFEYTNLSQRWSDIGEDMRLNPTGFFRPTITNSKGMHDNLRYLSVNGGGAAASSSSNARAGAGGESQNGMMDLLSGIGAIASGMNLLSGRDSASGASAYGEEQMRMTRSSCATTNSNSNNNKQEDGRTTVTVVPTVPEVEAKDVIPAAAGEREPAEERGAAKKTAARVSASATEATSQPIATNPVSGDSPVVTPVGGQRHAQAVTVGPAAPTKKRVVLPKKRPLLS